MPICPAATRIIYDAVNVNTTLVGPRESFNRHGRTEVFEPTVMQCVVCRCMWVGLVLTHGGGQVPRMPEPWQLHAAPGVHV